MHARFVIEKKISEGSRAKTLVLDRALKAEPGQFVMVWLPGVAEKPMSVANDDPFSLSIAARGEFSKRLLELPEGSSLFVRGPYGHGFEIQGKKALVIAGGCGAAPMRFLAKKAVEQGVEVTFLMGARTASELMLKPANCEVQIATDDGSAGFKGFVTQLAERLLEQRNYDCIYACGPEAMLVAIFKLCESKRIPCQLSLERYMKCGIGICGSCVCNKYVVCRDGPVFSSEQLREMSELGRAWRDASGRKHEVGE